MTPRTRSGNGDVEFKVYYSKKVPQQVHFPHKSKTVRRRTTPVRDGSRKRQMVFLPEQMKRQGTLRIVEDSDEDSGDVDLEGGLEGEGVARSLQADEEQDTPRKRNRKGKKRNSDILQEDSSEDDGSPGPMNKRLRKDASTKDHRRSRRVQSDSDDENNESNNVSKERMLKRQSTMTQLVEGRKPLPGSEGPDFKPVRQGPRLSWNGRDKATKDGKQRTLTQMVPGMRSLEIMSDEDVEDTLSDIEAQEADSQNYQDAVARRLAQQGLYRNDNDDREELTDDEQEAEEDIQPTVKTEDEENEQVVYPQDVPELVLQSVEDDVDGDGEDSYEPTQFIDAPVARTRRMARQSAAVPATRIGEASYVPQKGVRSRKARFSLLSTPEKRRIREIPSSQSPADSPLSTQVTPQKLHRSPLKKCTGNEIQVPETPSKRKQVTFKMPSKTPVPPPTLRKFESTIQDSEDEDDGIIEDNLPLGRRRVGADTQTLPDQIDRVCAGADEDGAAEAGSSQELDDSPVLRSVNESSPELGEPQNQSNTRQQRAGSEEHSSHPTELTSVNQEPTEDVEGDDLTVLPANRSHSQYKERSTGNNVATVPKAELSTIKKQPHSTTPIIQDTCPSTPMAIPEDSSGEDSPQPSPTPPQSSRQNTQYPSSPQIQQSTDLDGDLIQVPRSPSPQPDETQQSHSSKAEQQLQNEWFSYSQYVHDARSPQSSSMQAAPHAFSYNETPRLLLTAEPHHQHGHSGVSQATTVDEITQRTPRKNKTQHFSSTHTTPHRIASSQPIISPVKPPPLFIPSSFPSPEKAVADGWSSPVLGGMTQGGAGYRSSQWGASLEDFSIPLPPPMVGEEGEDE